MTLIVFYPFLPVLLPTSLSNFCPQNKIIYTKCHLIFSVYTHCSETSLPFLLVFRSRRRISGRPYRATCVPLLVSALMHQQWFQRSYRRRRNLSDRNAAKEMHDRSDRCAYYHPSVLLSHRNDDIHDLNYCGSKKNPRDS